VSLRILLSLIVVIVLAGCGGGNSRDAFVKDALAICGKAESTVKALGTPESFTETQLYARQAHDAVGDEIRDLRELTPPPELDDAFADYVATLELRRRQLDVLAAAADENNMADIQGTGSELDVLTAKARSQARKAGIAGCESG
jgi:hypothetical protein